MNIKINAKIQKKGPQGTKLSVAKPQVVTKVTTWKAAFRKATSTPSAKPK